MLPWRHCSRTLLRLVSWERGKRGLPKGAALICGWNMVSEAFL